VLLNVQTQTSIPVTTLQSTLTSAVSGGSFNSNLATAATNTGTTTQLASVKATGASVSNVQVTTPAAIASPTAVPTKSPTTLPSAVPTAVPTTGSKATEANKNDIIIGVVVGLGGGLICIGVIAYFVFFKKGYGKAATAEPGNVV